MPAILVPRYPPAPQPRVADDHYSEINPGVSNTGFGISPETKKRLEDLLVTTTERVAGRVFPSQERDEPEKVFIPVTGDQEPNPQLANEVVAAQVASRQQFLLIGLGVLAVVGLTFAFRG